MGFEGVKKRFRCVGGLILGFFGVFDECQVWI